MHIGVGPYLFMVPMLLISKMFLASIAAISQPLGLQFFFRMMVAMGNKFGISFNTGFFYHD